MNKCKCGQDLLIPHEIAAGVCMGCILGCMLDAQMMDDENPFVLAMAAVCPINESKSGYFTDVISNE